MADRSTAKKALPPSKRKPVAPRKVKDDPVSTAASIPAAAKAETNPNVRLRLEKGIAELQGLHELLL